MTDEAPSRRTVLAAAIRGAPLAALPLMLGACRGVQVLGAPPPPPADVRALTAAITAEEQLVASYGAAIGRLQAADTAAAVALRTVQDEHAAHLTQLRSRLTEPVHRPPAPQPVTIPPGGTATILQALGQAEQTASDRLIGQLRVLPPALAQLFASIAASEATHVPYLHQVPGAAP